MATTELSHSESPSDLASPSPRGSLPLVAMFAAGCLVLAHLPLVALHMQQIWLRPHYQFFPLVFLGAAVLFVLRVRNLGPLTPGSVLGTALLFAGTWIVLASAELLYSSWLGAVAALLSLAAALFAVGGITLLRAGLPSLALLCVAIPPPFELDRTLILSLQAWTAQWGSQILDMLGVYHVLSGHVVEISGQRFLVEEACSGINSLFSVLACTLFFVFFERRGILHSTLLIAAGIGWVLAANVVRVVAVAYLATSHGIDLGSGWRHEALGMVLFGLALALVWSTDRFLLFLTAPAPPARPDSAMPPAANPTQIGPLSGLVVASVAGAFLVPLAGHMTLYGAAQEVMPASGALSRVNPHELTEQALPERFGRWQRHSFDTASRNLGSDFGEFSRMWTYQLGPYQATLSFDHPFPSWHDLTRCYTGQGWGIEQQTVHRAPDDFVEVEMSKPAYRSGYLLYAEFDGQGQTLEARRGGAYLSLHRHDSALRRWLGPKGDASVRNDPPGPIYQGQLFIETQTPLTEQGRAEARALFARALTVWSQREEGETVPSVDASPRGD